MTKRLLSMVLATVMCAMAVHANVGEMSAGMQFSYASKNTMMGLGLHFQVEVVKNLRIQPEFIYYFENKNLSDFNVNLNLHYLIPTGRGYIYPMAGFSYVNFRDKTPTETIKTDKCGANIGIGYEYLINDRFRFYTEQRFHILKDWNESVTCLGLRCRF